MRLLTPCSVLRGGFLYTMIVPGGGFLLPSSHVPGGAGVVVMDEIDTCIKHTNTKCFFPVPLGTDRYEGSHNCHVNCSKLVAHFILKVEGANGCIYTRILATSLKVSVIFKF